MRHIFKLINTIALAISFLLAGCGGGGGTDGSPASKTLIGIDVRASQDRLFASGSKIQFAANGNYSDGTSDIDLTGVTWTSSDPQIAQVDSSGQVTGVALGNATITARIGNITGTNTVGVTAPITGWTAVSVGANHILALKNDGSLWSWSTPSGDNAYGQLGNGGYVYNNSFFPVQVGTDTDWDAVHAGTYRSFALKKDGTLWGWGNNRNSELGDNNFGNDQLAPAQIGTATDWRSISTAWGHTLAIKQDGSLWAWGYGLWSQLGVPNTSTGYANNYEAIPTRVGSDTDWVMASAGNTHSMAIKTDGSLWAWGTSEHGELGNGIDLADNYVNRYYVPTRIGTDNNWSAVAAGYWNTLALKTDGSLYGWGWDYGVDSSISATTISPARMGTGNAWAAVVTGPAISGGKIVARNNSGNIVRPGIAAGADVQLGGSVSGWVAMSAGALTMAIDGSGAMYSVDSSSATPVVAIPAGGSGKGPSPSVVAPVNGGSGGSAGSSLLGIWANSNTTWTFNSNGTAVIDQISLNYGANAHQITTIKWTSTASSVTYKITRAQLTCTCQYSYDETIASSDPMSGPFTESYTINGTTLKIGTEVLYKR